MEDCSMRILVNCSNLKKGGGLQVADSVCGFLNQFNTHDFVVVLSSYMDATAKRIEDYGNVEVVRHDIQNSCKTLLMGRDDVLDAAVERYEIDAVLTIFGPARWSPRRPHLCGFARSQLVLSDSPYFARMSYKNKVAAKIMNCVLKVFFKRGTTALWTENSLISEKLSNVIKNRTIYTVSNYYNQIFDDVANQSYCKLPEFDGITLLTVSAPYGHKNLEIAIDVAKYLKNAYADFKFRFVMTIKEQDYPELDDSIKDCFCFVGKVDIAQVPSLYEQSDISFQPTLLECFTATYPESMRMGLPIITTDLNFAHGLCGEAAIYYDALSPEKCAEAVYRLATNEALKNDLVQKGKAQLKKFYNAEERATKLIEITAGLAQR